MSDIPFKNPGWAGNTGEFDLTEEQVRGDDFVGDRPTGGGHAAGAVHVCRTCWPRRTPTRRSSRASIRSASRRS